MILAPDEHATPNQQADTLLEDPEDFHRRRVLMYYSMALMDRSLSCLGQRRPQMVCHSVPYVRLFTCSLVLTCITLVPLLLFQYNIPATIWFHLYLGLVLFVQFWSVEYVNRKLLSALLRQDGIQYRTRQFWESLSVRQRYQALPGLLCALFAAVLAPLLFREVFNESPGIPLYVAFVLQGFLLGAGCCGFIVGATRFVQNINAQYFKLYAFDPRRSPIVDHISQIFEATLWAFSLNLAVLLLPLAFVRRTPLVLSMAMVVSVVGLGLLIGVFVFAQQRLTALVKEQKQLTLIALQRRIEILYQAAEKLDKATFEDLQNLMKLHDQIADASEWGVSATRLWSYARTLVLPGITALYANRELIVAVYQQLRI